MGLFDSCILACDIDGTLMIDGEISPRNIESIGYFMNEGGYFSLSTGRTVDAVAPVLAKIKRVSPSVVANGCMIYDYENKKVLFETCVPKSDYRIAENVLKMGLNVGIEAHSRNKILNLKRTSETDDHQKYEWIEGTDVSYDEACTYNWNKVVYLFDNTDDLATVKKMIASEPTKSSFSDTTTTFGGKKRNYYEQFATGTSKSVALDKLCDILNIKKDCRFAIGDYYNDVEMIKSADISATTAEAPEEIKDCADFVTGPCKDGAVADFINYLIKIRED